MALVSEQGVKWLLGVPGLAVISSRNLLWHTDTQTWKNPERWLHKNTKPTFILKDGLNNKAKLFFSEIKVKQKRKERKTRRIWIFALWVNICKPHVGVVMHSFGYYSNTAHRLGKYPVLSSVYSFCCCCCLGQLVIKQQTWHKIRTLSFLTLTQCAHFFYNLKRVGFIYNRQPDESLI